MASSLFQDEHNYFVCSCNDTEEIPAVLFNQHLEEKHGMKPPHKGTRSMVSHIDYTKHFSWTYKWTFEQGFSAHQFTHFRRNRK